MEHVVQCSECDRFDQASKSCQRPSGEFVLDAWKTHYPSMPASNAFRLSSSEDMPVSARITLD